MTMSSIKWRIATATLGFRVLTFCCFGIMLLQCFRAGSGNQLLDCPPKTFRSKFIGDCAACPTNLKHCSKEQSIDIEECLRSCDDERELLPSSTKSQTRSTKAKTREKVITTRKPLTIVSIKATQDEHTVTITIVLTCRGVTIVIMTAAFIAAWYRYLHPRQNGPNEFHNFQEHMIAEENLTDIPYPTQETSECKTD